ncbi:alpha-L-fucosidase [Aliiglaciecola lipolytica]|uniref:alpha-L-fucosidase n=1 Tax=Aliiglaciecola lipolytica E3 TaxID=1127673 RepID=K6YZ30_9ALTE|nr:alpha-L-fucosidase [Aliiglaciecola lipolytica]GAC16465.1 hypothetical protein GLIP_3854 [Aliiglaciecola lipolytica E3]
MNRRDFLAMSAVGAGVALLPGCMSRPMQNSGKLIVPPYLTDYQDAYQQNPRAAATEWFRDARYGLFIHYGLYSLMASGEWVLYSKKVPLPEYVKLKDQFTAEKFDADFITDLALDAGMKYINITTRHHDSFCLWDTEFTEFNSVNSPAKRDLVRELSEQCNKKGLALFLYYSHGRDWKHPHAPNNDKWGGAARPNYDFVEPSYKYGAEHDLDIYLDFMTNQVNELMTNYSNVAGIWLDGIGVPYSGDRSVFKAQDLYDLVHAKQPQTLVSYKQGLLGTEDFLAPERKFDKSKGSRVPLELCDHLQRKSWGYDKSQDGNHKKKDEVIKMLKRADSYPANLLLNTGPKGSGEIPAEDVAVLREVGKELKTKGWEGVLAS